MTKLLLVLVVLLGGCRTSTPCQGNLWTPNPEQCTGRDRPLS